MKTSLGRNKFFLIAAFVIFVLAVWVRTYSYHDWLYFKMDQARDAFTASNAVINGPGHLPLLGARAGATDVSRGFLYLGPAFYYFQYISGAIFKSTKPEVFAYPDLFFSLLAIPLVYLLSRIYFSEKLSFVITILYSFSFIIIQYSRFAWNPNSLQFFTLLCFYALLRLLNEEEWKQRALWTAAWAFALSIGSQLHFLGFFILVGISGIMILFHFEMWKAQNVRSLLKFSTLKTLSIYALIVMAVFLMTYAPEIISETMKNFRNSKNFIEALSTKPADKPLLEKIVKSVKENLKYYSLIATSFPYKDSLRTAVPAIFFTFLIFGAGIIVAMRRFFTVVDRRKKDFLALIIVWIGMFFLLSIPVSFQLRPRFFILVFAVPFILIAFIWEYLEEKYGKRGMVIGALVASISLVSNISGTYAWFREQTDSQIKPTPVERTLILKNKDGVTLGQLEKVADWIYSRKKPNANIYYYVKPEHNRPIDYLLNENNRELEYTDLKDTDDPNGQFFAVTPSKNGIKPFTDKYGENAVIMDNEQFGQLEVFEVGLPDRQIDENFKLDRSKGGSDRLYWKDVLGGEENAIREEDDGVTND